MNYSMTFVAANVLDEAAIEKIFDLLQSMEITFDKSPIVLAIEKAIDVLTSDNLTKDEIDRLRDKLDQIDVFFNANENRRKKLFIADMDSTIVNSETLDELAAFANVKDKVAEITDLSMRGKINFEDSLKKRVALVSGIKESHMQEILEQTQLNPGAQTAVKTMRKHDCFCVLVSGGFTFFTGAIAKKVGFNDHRGNILDIKDGALTGKVVEPVLGPNAKRELMRDYCKNHMVLEKDVCAIGDGANDRFMLEAAGTGIGYYPKPLLQEKLMNQIRYTDLTSLLYCQGYKKEDMVEID